MKKNILLAFFLSSTAFINPALFASKMDGGDDSTSSSSRSSSGHRDEPAERGSSHHFQLTADFFEQNPTFAPTGPFELKDFLAVSKVLAAADPRTLEELTRYPFQTDGLFGDSHLKMIQFLTRLSLEKIAPLAVCTEYFLKGPKKNGPDRLKFIELLNQFSKNHIAAFSKNPNLFFSKLNRQEFGCNWEKDFYDSTLKIFSERTASTTVDFLTFYQEPKINFLFKKFFDVGESFGLFIHHGPQAIGRFTEDFVIVNPEKYKAYDFKLIDPLNAIFPEYQYRSKFKTFESLITIGHEKATLLLDRLAFPLSILDTEVKAALIMCFENIPQGKMEAILKHERLLPPFWDDQGAPLKSISPYYKNYFQQLAAFSDDQIDEIANAPIFNVPNLYPAARINILNILDGAGREKAPLMLKMPELCHLNSEDLEEFFQTFQRIDLDKMGTIVQFQKTFFPDTLKQDYFLRLRYLKRLGSLGNEQLQEIAETDIFKANDDGTEKSYQERIGILEARFPKPRS